MNANVSAGTDLITLELTCEQANLILAALMERPFKLVYELIGSLNAQAAQALAQDANKAAALRFTRRQMRLIIEALAELPYRQVQALLPYLHRQVQLATAHAPERAAQAAQAAQTGWADPAGGAQHGH